MIINGQAYDVEQAMSSPIEPADGEGVFAAPRNAGVHRGRVHSDMLYGMGEVLRNSEASGFVVYDGPPPCFVIIYVTHSPWTGPGPGDARFTVSLQSSMGPVYIKESTTIRCEVTYRLESDGSVVGSDTADLIVTGDRWWGPVAVSPDVPDAMDFLGEDYFERALGYVLFAAPSGQYITDAIFNIVP